MDTHLLALEKLGVQIDYDRMFEFKASKLIGADILLDEASVTATENAIMACVLAEGVSTLRNAASEPHVQELCHLLVAMGAQIENTGSNTLIINGVSSLHGADFTIGPDYLEVVSFIGAAAVTHGEITIRNAGNKYLDMIKLVFGKLGVTWEERGDDLFVPSSQKLEIEPDLGVQSPRSVSCPGRPSQLT